MAHWQEAKQNEAGQSISLFLPYFTNITYKIKMLFTCNYNSKAYLVPHSISFYSISNNMGKAILASILQF